MDAADVTLQVLPAYQLKLTFPNGSEAVVDLKHRINAIRFGRLAEPGFFSTARLEGSEVVWDDGTYCLRASINELLDSMQLGG
ncbi:hypothetical protein ACTQ33_14845 [Candidatus Avoscillospira sp. LCP25S3_F1]|uniref:hypothetical protein n=1 Tax=Candidatus Avoscillospira sp. LCP25S3_F1 TaxID=3438825 RepID=UPI003F8DC057